MKKLYVFFASLTLLSFLSSCKKEEVSSTNYYDEAAAHADDQARFSAELDAILNDVNFALELTPGFSGKPEAYVGTVCGVTITADTLSNPRKLTITYSGASCSQNRNRTGQIIVTMDSNKRWKDPGTEVTLSFVNLNITRLKDNKDMIFNNKIAFTNVNGGLLNELGTTSTTVTHSVFSDDIDITFDNGKEWSWKTSRKRVYRQNNGLVITTTGTQVADNITGIADWGNTRNGQPFLTPILQPMERRQDCNFRIVSGKIEIILTGRLYATGYLGRNESGNIISCPGSSNYWLELTWRDIKGTRCILRLPYE